MRTPLTLRPSRHPRRPAPASLPWLALVGVALTIGTGCGGVPVHEQRLVAQPNMQFSRSPALSGDVRLLAQIETGAAMSAGATASGCTSCR